MFTGATGSACREPDGVGTLRFRRRGIAARLHRVKRRAKPEPPEQPRAPEPQVIGVGGRGTHRKNTVVGLCVTSLTQN